MLAHVEFLSCYQDPSGHLHLGSPHPILVAGVIPPQVQNMAFSFVEMQEVPPAPGGPLIVEGNQVGQAGPALHQPMLTGPDPSVCEF